MAGAGVWLVPAIAWDNAAAETVTRNLSEADNELVSVAATLVFGVVPVKDRDVDLNVNDDGSAEPFACPAVWDNVTPIGSAKV
jgi:hypothetical protein